MSRQLSMLDGLQIHAMEIPGVHPLRFHWRMIRNGQVWARSMVAYPDAGAAEAGAVTTALEILDQTKRLGKVG